MKAQIEAICVHICPAIFAEARATTEGITEQLVCSVDIHATCFSLLLLLVSLYSLAQSPPISLSLLSFPSYLFVQLGSLPTLSLGYSLSLFLSSLSEDLHSSVGLAHTDRLTHTSSAGQPQTLTPV